MPLAELLICQPPWGPTRCRTFLGSLGLDDSKTLGVLTNRQRIAVTVALSTKPRGPILQVGRAFLARAYGLFA
jgi:hypothetical protein